AVRDSGAEVRFTDVVVRHTGYTDPAFRRKKIVERDLPILKKAEQQWPDHPFVLYNLGSTYQALGLPEQALPYLRRSLARSAPADSIVRKLHALVSECLGQQGQVAEALEACLEGRRLYPDDAELLFREGALREALGDLAGAAGAFERLVNGKE